MAGSSPRARARMRDVGAVEVAALQAESVACGINVLSCLGVGRWADFVGGSIVMHEALSLFVYRYA